MPCRSDYLAASNHGIEASKVLALIEELETGILPDYYNDGYYKEVYSKNAALILQEKVPILCEKLQQVKDVTKYSLELQIWWRDHQKADKKRIEDELFFLSEEIARKSALDKLSDFEKKLLNLK